MPKPRTDAELLARLQAGDERALDDLVRAYRSKIYQLAYRYLRNKEDAEEVAQDVLYKVHRKVGTFRGDSALSSWIYRITFNAAMSRLRTSKYPHAQADEGGLTWHDGEQMLRPVRRAFSDSSEMADERVFRSQARMRVFGAIRRLPLIYRGPVVLRDVRGLSTEEASAVLHVKDQTLKSRLHRGRLILRKQLGDFESGLTLHQAAA